MKNYLQLLENVLKLGDKTKDDRTGVGTLSLTAQQLRFKLSEGFPLYTTKKVFTRGFIYELMWFLRGDTNIKFLTDHGVHIWDDWLKPNKTIGGLSDKRPIVKIKPVMLSSLATDTVRMPLGGDHIDELFKEVSANVLLSNMAITENMTYYDQFSKAVKNAVNYELWLENPDDYIFTPCYYGSFVYDINNCVFLHKDEFDLYVEIDYNHEFYDRLYTFKDIYKYRKNKNMLKAFSLDDIEGEIDEKSLTISSNEYWNKYDDNPPTEFIYRYALSEGDLGPIYPYQFRHRDGNDQLANVIDTLQTNPNSRRMIIDNWDLNELDNMSLPSCCHSLQFVAKDGKLDLIANFRSNDLALGNPFNVPEFTVLLHMVAQVTGHTPREFIINMGDAHIYLNQIEGIKEQLQREPLPLCTFEYTGHWDDEQKQFIHTVDDFVFKDYRSHEPIVFPVAV